MSQTLQILFAGVVAVATALGVWLTYRGRAKNRTKYRLFFSVQFNGLSDLEYEAVQKEIFEVLDFAKNLENVEDIYYFNRNIPTKEDFEGKEFLVSEYMRELAKCDYFIGIFQKRIHSSIYTEAGFAMAREKRCFFYTKANQEDVLPTVLAECVDIYEHVSRTDYKEIGEVATKLKGLLPNLGNGILTNRARL